MCQLEELNTITEDNSFVQNGWHFMKRIPRFLKNRIHLIKYVFFESFREEISEETQRCALNLKTGDKVRVRSKKEIDSTLDAWKKYQGCSFMDEMWKFCGKDYTVLKKVNRILDERDMKMKRCKNMVILKDLICHGSWPFNNCDRSCFFFWKEIWLEKINE